MPLALTSPRRGAGPTNRGTGYEMSGIQGLKRLEVRDLDGVPSGLLIGRTESGSLVIGIAPPRGEAPMVAIDRHDPLAVKILELIGTVVTGGRL